MVSTLKKNDIILIFTYIAPERSPIYAPENDNGILLLNEKKLTLSPYIQMQR